MNTVIDDAVPVEIPLREISVLAFLATSRLVRGRREQLLEGMSPQARHIAEAIWKIQDGGHSVDAAGLTRYSAAATALIEWAEENKERRPSEAAKK